MTFTVEQAVTSAKRRDAGKIYLGTPCVRGHRGWRYMANKLCVQCHQDRDKRRRIQRNAHVDHQIAPHTVMHITPWWKDEFGNMTRQIWAK